MEVRRIRLGCGDYEREAEPFGKDEIAFYQCDHLGTPQELTDYEGKVAWSAQYKACGQAREAISDAAYKAGMRNPIRFQGQYEDEETGLFYNRHRYYDPDAARYLTQDPIGLAGGINVYAYTLNSTGWIDPLGLNPRCPWRPNMSSLEKSAHDIHGAILKPTKSPIAFNSSTVAVASLADSAGNIQVVAATSTGTFTPAQRAVAASRAITPIELKYITGPSGHAERIIIEQYAERNGLTVKDIAASRPICETCQECIDKHGANPVSPRKNTRK